VEVDDAVLANVCNPVGQLRIGVAELGEIAADLVEGAALER
jgi:hypothetical protein